ncbi:MAG: UDP-N-acetylmuramoylalanyl-D-glutamate--2,6-diaminopimelate ligase [Planctomycetaceae bacterium]|nr:UDP-N-acetylmuramoylalanyl-D-glutamate--2,6-diaminopimelate ligase [Planctomycetaceae bacterium]
MRPTSLSEVARITNGELTPNVGGAIQFRSVSTDSRQLKQGDLFWALRGETHDGHEFLDEAHKQGAAGCVVADGRSSGPDELPTVRVKDTLAALKAFARWHRNCQEARVVGVTGSVGKTTTRELIYSVLGGSLQGMRSPANFNNHLGLPLSLLSVHDQHEFAVLELGASAVGEIRDLATVARPEIGVVTGIAPVHLSGFGSLQRIAQAKAELLASLPHSGVAIVPGDDPFASQLAEAARCRVVRVGARKINSLQATDVRSQGDRLRVRIGSSKFDVPGAFPHNLSSVLAAIAVGREFSLNDERIAAGLQSFQQASGRTKILQIGLWRVIDDTYNSSPVAVTAACNLLKHFNTSQRKVLVLGDMLELGKHAPRFHRQAGRDAASVGLDSLLVLGKWADHVVEGAMESGLSANRITSTQTHSKLFSALESTIQPGDVILIKGSRGMRMEQVVEKLRELARRTQPHRQIA